MNLVTAEEPQRNERLRKAPKRRCAACGAKLNRYANRQRVLCSLCLSHDTEARLICASRLEAGRRVTIDPERLADVAADALHAGLWRMAVAEAAYDLRVIPAGGGGLLEETPAEAARTLVANRERIRGIWYVDGEERRDPGALLALIEDGYLVHIGYAAWSEVASLWSVWLLYPRSYGFLGGPRR